MPALEPPIREYVRLGDARRAASRRDLALSLRRPIVAALLVAVGLIANQAMPIAEAEVTQSGGLPTGSYSALPALGFNEAILHDYAPASQWRRSLQLFHQAGATWLRLDASWAALEPEPGLYSGTYLSEMDSIVATARHNGLNVLFVVMGTPTWDLPPGSSPTAWNTPPLNISSYGQAMALLAKRYASDSVAWELWNEPNYSHFLSNTSPATYASLACVGYAGVKSVAPHAIVVAGALSGSDAQWLEAAYRDGLKGCFDVLSVHPYDRIGQETPGPSWEPPVTVGAVRKVMVDNGDGNKPIWITEFGWYADATPGSPLPIGGVTLREQAHYTERYIDELTREYPYVTHVMFYNGTDSPGTPPEEAFAGALSYSLQPKPVYNTLRSMYG
jgi:polysaccharide biosynthesis protein PslG